MKLLPDSAEAPKIDYTNLTYMIYGPPGIGKTTFCAGLENALFLDTEKGTSLQKVHRVAIPDWPTFIKVTEEIVKGGHTFENIVIDTIGRLVLSCIRYCVDKLGIVHPSDMQWGKGYDIIKKTFDKPIHVLQHSDYALWLVGHSSQRKIQSRGREFDYTEPELPGFVSKLVIPLCDFVFHATNDQVRREDSEGKVRIVDERVIKTKPSQNYMAKDRFPQDRTLPETIPLDTATFLNLFNGCLNGDRK